MQKFLNYKSKIVNGMRDSQKIQEEDIFQMVRQYQLLKIIKKYGKDREELEMIEFDRGHQPIGQETLVEGQQIDTPNRSSDCSTYQNEQISMEKQQLTMSSLFGSESNDSSSSKQPSQQPYAPCTCLLQGNTYHISSSNIVQNSKESNQTINHFQARVKAREEMQSAKQDLSIFANPHIQFLNFYEQPQHKQSYYPTKNASNLSPFTTSRQPLQLSQLHLSKSKTRQRSILFDEPQSIITQEENQKIEMLFREQYKDIFLSSISNIQFNEFSSSSNSLKQELEGTSEIFANDSPEVNRFQTILDIIKQKDSKNKQKTEKQEGNQQLPRKRQKVIILNSKQPTSKNGKIINNAKTAKPMQKEKRTASRK